MIKNKKDVITEVMEDYSDIIKKEAEEQSNKYNKVMDSVKRQVSDKIFKEIEEEIEESEGGFNFDIVDACSGEKETNVKDDIEIWVDQTTNGGYTGDEFAGNVYVKLPDGKYLTWEYSM